MGWGASRKRKIALLALPALALLPTPAFAGPGELEIRVANLRNNNGVVRLCITTRASAFPGCEGDPRAYRLTVSPQQAQRFTLRNVPPGTYAISVIHDENSNGELDTRLGIPREGYGFSTNPGFSFGAPAFGRVAFQVGPNGSSQIISMRYIL